MFYIFLLVALFFYALVGAVFPFVNDWVLVLVGMGLAGAALAAVAVLHGKSVAVAQEAASKAQTERLRKHFQQNPDHLRVLRRIRKRTVYKDEYGDYQFDRWHAEVQDYIEHKLVPFVFPENTPELLGKVIDDVLADEDEAVHGENLEAKAAPTNSAGRPVSTSTVGRDFEAECAKQFQAQHFDVWLTPSTGDQGADIIASRGKYRIAVQCKKHDGTVGNKAVQEAAAARVFYDCTHAIVVADSGYTTSARQLAESLGVALLTSEEIASLRKSMLVKPAGASSRI